MKQELKRILAYTITTCLYFFHYKIYCEGKGRYFITLEFL